MTATTLALLGRCSASMQLPLTEWVHATADSYTSAAEQAAVPIDVVLCSEDVGHEDVGTGERIAY